MLYSIRTAYSSISLTCVCGAHTGQANAAVQANAARAHTVRTCIVRVYESSKGEKEFLFQDGSAISEAMGSKRQYWSYYIR